MNAQEQKREQQRELRALVQGEARFRVPKKCKHPDGCPMGDKDYGGSVPAICFDVCGVRKEQ